MWTASLTCIDVIYVILLCCVGVNCLTDLLQKCHERHFVGVTEVINMCCVDEKAIVNLCIHIKDLCRHERHSWFVYYVKNTSLTVTALLWKTTDYNRVHWPALCRWEWRHWPVLCRWDWRLWPVLCRWEWRHWPVLCSGNDVTDLVV